MSSSKKIKLQSTDEELEKTDEFTKPSKKPYFIGFIVFVILAAALILFALYWFVWRSPDPTGLEKPCSSNNQCNPDQFCNTKTGLCNAQSCTIGTECDTLANGSMGSVCLRGYCQVPSCNSNIDCANVGTGGSDGTRGDYVCSKYAPDPLLNPWITNTCVLSGGTCKSNNDCFGGNAGLVCIGGDGGVVGTTSTEDTGVCQQCGRNSDCDGGLVCSSSGVCSECGPITDSPEKNVGGCDNDNVCGNGTCCSDPQYIINGMPSCSKGELFDICEDGEDDSCKSGKCVDLGTGTHICGGGTNGPRTFSAGAVASFDIPEALSCGLKSVDPADTTSTPFAVDGACNVYSADSLSATVSALGSACGRPSYCRNSSRAANLLCTGDVTFENPFAIGCTKETETTDCPSGSACAFSGICGPICKSTFDAEVGCGPGFVCLDSNGGVNNPSLGNGVCQYPKNKIKCSPSNCTATSLGGPIPAACECPNSYACDEGNGNVCVWAGAGDDPSNPIPPPPPFIIDSVCTRPGTALPTTSGSIDYIPSFCVNGGCTQNAGWINSVCEGDGDCMYLGGKSSSDPTRKGLNCIQGATFNGQTLNVCTQAQQ